MCVPSHIHTHICAYDMLSMTNPHIDHVDAHKPACCICIHIDMYTYIKIQCIHTLAIHTTLDRDGFDTQNEGLTIQHMAHLGSRYTQSFMISWGLCCVCLHRCLCVYTNFRTKDMSYIYMICIYIYIHIYIYSIFIAPPEQNTDKIPKKSGHGCAAFAVHGPWPRSTWIDTS